MNDKESAAVRAVAREMLAQAALVDEGSRVARDIEDWASTILQHAEEATA